MTSLKRLTRNFLTIEKSDSNIFKRDGVQYGDILVRSEEQGGVEVLTGLEIVMSRGDKGFSTACLSLPIAGTLPDLKPFLREERELIVTRTYYFSRYSPKTKYFSGVLEREITRRDWPITFELVANAMRSATSKY